MDTTPLAVGRQKTLCGHAPSFWFLKPHLNCIRDEMRRFSIFFIYGQNPGAFGSEIKVHSPLTFSISPFSFLEQFIKQAFQQKENTFSFFADEPAFLKAKLSVGAALVLS